VKVKRNFVVILLIAVVFLGWQMATSIKAQANLNTLLLAYGQTPVPLWRSVIRGSPREQMLIAGQLDVYKQVRVDLMSDMKYVESQPAGWFVPVKDPDAVDGRASIPKDDWLLLEATPALAKLDSQITSLEQ